MPSLVNQLKASITEKDRKDAWREHTRPDSRNPKSKVVMLEIGYDNYVNQRVYDFLSGFMDESRIIVVGGTQRLEKYISMPRVHDYTGSYPHRTLFGEEGVKVAFPI